MPVAVRTIALTCLLALGAAACGAGDPEPPVGAAGAHAILRQATDDLTEQTVRARFEMAVDAGGESFAATGEMTIDPKHERAHMRLVSDDVPTMPSGTAMEIVADGTTIYVRSDVVGGPTWLKIDAAEHGMHGGFEGSGQIDPSAFLAFLRGADGIEVVGSDEVRGVATTHFSGSLDLSDLVEHTPEGEERDAATDAIEGLGSRLGDLGATFDAWVDADGIPWRVSFAFAPEAADGSFELTMDILEIGGQVDIEIPSPEDVTELGDFGLPTAA